MITSEVLFYDDMICDMCKENKIKECVCITTLGTQSNNLDICKECLDKIIKNFN